MCHHARHVRLVLSALPIKEIDDDAKASSADFRIIVVFISVRVEQTNHQDQSLERKNNRTVP